MGVVDFFKKIYFKIEDQYYAFCDAVEKTGIKIYEWFVNPIEKRGIPSFPVFALLSLLLLAGIVFLALGGLGSIFQSTNNISISLSSDGLPVEGVSGRLLVDGLDSAFTATSNSQGVLLFEGVPADKKATLRISDPNYEPLIQTISTSSTSLSLSLSPLGGGKKFTVIVVNQDDDPVSKALVSYTDSNGQLVSEFTDAQGRISVGYSRQDQLFYFKASKDGFSRESKTCSPGQNTCLIQLVHSDDSTTKAKKASVLVSVEDENGNPIEARVSLYNSFSDSKIDEANLEYGEAFFEEVVEEGTSVYVNIYPVDESFAPYLGGASGDEKITSAAFNTVFNIVLQRKTSVIPKTDFSKLGIIVSDADGAKIEGATISLYLQNEERILIDEQFTSSDGKAVFDTIQGSTYYVTAFAEGFLPLLEKGLIGGAERQYKLTKLLPGNHGDLEVEVLDADENPVEFAQVKLAYTDGFPLGMPVFETGADGKVLIEGVPLQNIKALVTKGALNGESDAIQVTISENKLVAHLERGFGTIRVRTRDASEAKRVLIAASIDAFVDEEKIVSCNTLSTGDGYCELKVWANNPIVLKANAGGFVATESEEIIVGINQKTDKELLMIPTALSDEIKVLSFEIQNAETNEVLPDGALLEKGGLYKVLITANIPQAEKGGISLRLGDKTSIQDEKAFLLDFDKPSDAKNSWGTIFDQEQACSALETRQESSEVKWLTNEFKTTGVRTLGTFLRVRASATKLDKINFYYRAFVSKNNIWGRDPVDDELGRSENTLEKESCFANTYSKSFGVVEGKGLCNDRGCLYVELSSSEQTVTNGLKVTLGGLFSVNSFVTSFQDPVNPKIIVSSLAKANVLDLEGAQSSTKDLQFSLRKAQSSVSGNTFLPTSNARLKIEYADDSGTILSTERYLSIEGTGVMSLVATPTDFETNVRKDLTITLRDDRGNAITDARVEIEDLEGSPLGGSVSGPLFILGDDSSDRGEDGLYKFRKLNPTSVGKLLVTAKRDGFATETKELRVFAKDFFDVNPTELTFQACGASGSFNLQSLIDVDVPIQVSTDGNCVALSSGEVKLTRTKPSSQYKVSANADGQCKVAFNSLLPGSGSVTELEALVTVTGCAPIPSKCSSNACGECNENECRSLEEKGFCSRDYETTPTGQRFLSCFKPPTVSVQPQVCDKNNCGGCSETQCRAFESQDNSCVWEPSRTAQFERALSPLEATTIDGITITLTSINNNKGVLDVSTQDALIEVSAGQQLSVGSVQLIIKSFSQGKMVFASVPGVCSQGPGVSQTKECGPGNCGLCSENQCLNLEALKECSPVYDVGKRDNKVSIQDVGGFKLDPSTITIIQGESIEFKNDGVKTHSLLIQETSSRIELGVGSIKPQSFNSPGTYTYCETTSSKCDSASVKGTITVVKKSSSGNQFLYCSVFDPNKKPPVELAQCDNPNDFDFGALLERRIALAQADQLLNPNKASRAVASSASNQVLLSFGQWVPQAFGAGCQQSSDGIVCNKQVTPLVPRNGVAVSISNQLGTDTQIDASLQGNSQCFTISNVEQRNTLDQFISGVQEGVSGALGLPQNQYRTYVISYDASKPNCGTWSIDSEGIVSLTANAQAKVRISSFSVAQLPPFVVTINIQGGAQSELAFKAMPLTVIQRGEMTEPFFFTNNLKTKITVNNKDVLVNTVTYSELDPTKPINVKIGSSEEKLSIDYDNPGSNAFDAIGYDVVGNLADSADCGDKDYCNPEQLSEYSSSIASQINTEVSPIYASMDRVKFGGLVTSSQDAFSKAFDDAQREFLASQQTYLACKALGVDPVAKLREKCDSVLTTPQDVYSGQLGSIYGDVFRQASCDSEFVNSFQALYGGGFNWNSYKQRLIGFASFQKSGYVDYGKPILANEDLVIRVPVKLAGRNGGISFLQFKTNANSLSYYGDSAIDDASWNRIDDISGSVGVPNLLDFVNGFSVSGTSGASIKSFQGTHFYVDGTNLLSSSSNAPTLFTVNKYAFSEPSETASNEVRQIAEYFKAGSFKESNPITILYSEENIPNNAQGAIALDVTKNTLTVYSRGTDSQPFAFQLAKYFADESYDFDSIPAGCSFEHVSENVIVFNNCVTSKEKTPEPVIEPKEPEIQVPSATSYQVEVKCGLPIAGTGDSRILSVKASTLAGTCPDTFSGTGNPGTSDAYCVYFYLSPRTFAPKNSNSLLDLAFSFRNGGIDVSSGSEWAGRTAIAVDESMLSVYRTPSRAPGYFLNLGESGSSESTTSETLYYRSVLPVNANQKQEGMKCYAKIYNLYQIAPTKFFMYLGGKELTTASGSSLGLPRRCLLGNYVSSWNPTNSLLTINEQANQVSVSTGEGCQDFVN